jgi:vancomycin resistance protein VanW
MPTELSLKDRILFRAKSALLIGRRGMENCFAPHEKHTRPPRLPNTQTLSEIASPLYTVTDKNEQHLQLGKVQNLRVAAQLLDGILIPAGGVFSFWKQIGRPSRGKGFVKGRELRQGCLIPTVAGGICQLSNALYQAARRAGLEICERHQHTQPIADAAFAQGEDATVFWNYVDLRFKADKPILLRVKCTQTDLVVRLEAADA